MAAFAWTRSFRARLLLATLLVTGLPLAIVAVSITRSASRSSEELLRARLHDAVEQAALGIVQRWTAKRGALLDLAADVGIREMLVRGGSETATDVSNAALAAQVAGPRSAFFAIVVRDPADRPVRSFESAGGGGFTPPGVPLSVPVYRSTLGPVVGGLDAIVPIGALVADRQSNPGSVGSIIGVFEARTGAPLVPLPFDRLPRDADTFAWGGDRWMTVRRVLADPPLELVGAAPLTPFEQPLREAARTSLWMLATVAMGGLALATGLASRMARSLQRLAAAAEAVADGALDRRVDEGTADEVGRVAKSFNRMTASLQTTLQALAEQRALARVGEFAASLAHEIRNPLTAIRVDLQVVQESLPEDARPVRPLRRALAEIERLDRTVEGALLVTRATRPDRTPVDVIGPLGAAVDAAERSSSRPIAIPIEVPLRAPVALAADTAALQQIFLNLLLNAVEAVRAGGDVRVVVEHRDARVVVSIIDTGVGLDAEVARQAFEPLFTTREGGTGLGLTIAARLAHALGGTVSLAGTPGHGATATVDLPGAD